MSILAESSATVIPAGTWSIDPVWSALEFEVKKLGLVDREGPRARASPERSRAARRRRSTAPSTRRASRPSTRPATGTCSRPSSSTRSAIPSSASSRPRSRLGGDELVVDGRPHDQGRHEARRAHAAAFVGAGERPVGQRAHRPRARGHRRPHGVRPRAGTRRSRAAASSCRTTSSAQGELRGGQGGLDDADPRHLRQPPGRVVQHGPRPGGRRRSLPDGVEVELFDGLGELPLYDADLDGGIEHRGGARPPRAHRRRGRASSSSRRSTTARSPGS